MSYRGDIRLGDTIDIKFTTVDVNGAPITLAGTPVVSAYPGNSTTELTAGITLTVDFDSRTGMHNVRVVATSGNGYATASNYDLVITTGTVGGTSVVGYVIGSFSIEARSAVMPTTVARTLDVSATGEAGVDWANVGGPTTTVDLSGTTIKTTQVVGSVTGAVGSVTGAVGSVTAGVTLAASAVQAIWDALTSALTTVGSVGKRIVDNLNDTISNVRSDVAGVQADTDNIQTRLPAGLVNGRMDSSVGSNLDKTGYALSATGADLPLDAALAEPTAVFDWNSATLRKVLAWLGVLSKNKITESGSTQTVRNDGDSATLATATVSDNGTIATRGKLS